MLGMRLRRRELTDELTSVEVKRRSGLSPIQVGLASESRSG